jgi:hypothetical protein
LYGLKKIPDVGEKWIEVWQGNKKYLKGDVILHKKIYSIMQKTGLIKKRMDPTF